MPEITDIKMRRQIRQMAWKYAQKWKLVKLPESKVPVDNLITACKRCGYAGLVKMLEDVLKTMDEIATMEATCREHIQALLTAGAKAGSKAVYCKNNYIDRNGNIFRGHPIPVTIVAIDPENMVLRVKHIEPPRFSYLVDPRKVTLAPSE